MQPSLIPIKILSDADAKDLGFDGTDLKRIALCDDGNTYAVKRVEDHPLIPISEWMGHHLCRRLGIATPDFAVLVPKVGDRSFGSRIANYQQIEEKVGSFRVNQFFSGNLSAISAIYTLDGVITNCDRHGRNMFLRTDAGGLPTVVAFDFSWAWLRTGLPFGNQERMRDSNTQQWWRVFKRMGCKADHATLSLLKAINVEWLHSVINSAPDEWLRDIDVASVLDFWETRSTQRLEWAKLWLT